MSVPVIVTIGKATQDVFMLSSQAFEPQEHKGVLYEQLPLGKKLDLDNVVFATGGNATNTAVTFARQGLHCKYIWAVGTDLASQTILQDLDSEGIDTSAVIEDKDYKASYSAILLADSGERTILNYHGTKLPNHGDELDLDGIIGADWVYLSGLGDMQLLENIITFCGQHGVKVMLNPASSELAEIAKLKALLDDVEILVANREEMELIVEGKSLEELARHARHYCPVVIVSDGPNGAVLTDGKTVINAGMYENVPVVDRTGGGDAFGAGFLSMWAQGKTLKEATIFASANSTSVVGRIGAKAGILHKGVQLHDMPIEEKSY